MGRDRSGAGPLRSARATSAPPMPRLRRAVHSRALTWISSSSCRSSSIQAPSSPGRKRRWLMLCATRVGPIAAYQSRAAISASARWIPSRAASMSTLASRPSSSRIALRPSRAPFGEQSSQLRQQRRKRQVGSRGEPARPERLDELVTAGDSVAIDGEISEQYASLPAGQLLLDPPAGDSGDEAPAELNPRC